MKYKIIILLVVFSFPAIGLSKEVVLVSEMMSHIQKAQLQPLVEYCKEEDHKYKNKMDDAYMLASKKIDQASIFIVELAKEQSEDTVPKKELDKILLQISEFGNSMVALVKEKGTAEVACSKFYDSLVGRTVEELEALMRKSYAEYTQRVNSVK